MTGAYEIGGELLSFVVGRVFNGDEAGVPVVRAVYRLVARELLAAVSYATAAPASLRDVLAERIHQIAAGYQPENDDELADAALAMAAVCYAEEAHCRVNDPERPMRLTWIIPEHWPWNEEDWKPSGGARRNLVKAAALLLAEIDRLDRLFDNQEQEVNSRPLTSSVQTQRASGRSADNGALLTSLERTLAGYMVGHDQSDQPKGGYSEGFVHGFGKCVAAVRRLVVGKEAGHD
ncbi:TPA: hypothetical protein ACSXXW_000947 [Pseudomonas aeruginosa]